MNRSAPGLPVHHQLLEFTQTHVHRVSDAIQPSHPLSSPSPPAPKPSQHQSFPMSQLFAWGGQSTGVSALTSFLPKKSQGWSQGFINILYIHTSDYYNRLDYGKDMHNSTCCYVTCNCGSKLSVHTWLDEYVKTLSWKASCLTIPVPVPLLAWPTSPLRCSVPAAINLFLQQDLRFFFVSLPRTKMQKRGTLQISLSPNPLIKLGQLL